MSVYSDDDEDFLADNQSTASSSGDDEPLLRPQAAQNFFAPPFYGRPPSPLPPSPSLTSLLRPSRPTTPDASDDELEPVPRASPKVPTYEYYGFVLYLFSSLTFVIWLLWSFLPSPILHALGIYYFPDRWWALALPSFLVMLFVYIYIALAAYNTEVMTLPMSALETVVDDASKIAYIDSKGRVRQGESERKMSEAKARDFNWGGVWNVSTDAVMDVPLAGVCEVLFANADAFEDLDS